jgi:hypothetical protein
VRQRLEQRRPVLEVAVRRRAADTPTTRAASRKLNPTTPRFATSFSAAARSALRRSSW